MNDETQNDENDTKILFTPNAFDELKRYLKRVEEYQYSINDELVVTREHVRHLEVEIYRLQATTQALRQHIEATANIIPPQIVIQNHRNTANTVHTIRTDDDYSNKTSHRTSKKRKKWIDSILEIAEYRDLEIPYFHYYTTIYVKHTPRSISTFLMTSFHLIALSTSHPYKYPSIHSNLRNQHIRTAIRIIHPRLLYRFSSVP